MCHTEKVIVKLRETFITSSFSKLRFLYIWIGFFLFEERKLKFFKN